MTAKTLQEQILALELPEPSGYDSGVGYFFEEDDMRTILKAAAELAASMAAQAPVREVPETWILCSDKLPEVGEWVNVLVDRNEGDYWDRKDKPRFSVHGAQLWDIDGEGYGRWRRWVMADGGPVGSLNHVTHWMPLPAAPVQQEGDHE